MQKYLLPFVVFALVLLIPVYSQSEFLNLCGLGSADAVADALKAGASVEERDYQGRTPLLLAATYNYDPRVVNELLKAGASINEVDSQGNTPLILAVMNDNADVMATFLKAGSSVNETNNVGLTALMNAAEFNSNPIVVFRLLKAGASVTAIDEKGWTALHHAAASNPNRLVAHFLLKYGASVNVRDHEGKTPLMLAAGAFGADPGVIEELWNAGGSATEKDSSGKSALDYARENPALNGSSILKTLELQPSTDLGKEKESPRPFSPDQGSSQQEPKT